MWVKIKKKIIKKVKKKCWKKKVGYIKVGTKKSKNLKKKWGKKISSKSGVKIRLNMGENKLWLEAHSYK